MVQLIAMNSFDFRSINLYSWFAPAQTYSIDRDVVLDGVLYGSHLSYITTQGADAVSIDYYGRNFQFDTVDQVPTAGTLSAIYTWFRDPADGAWYYNFMVRGFSVPLSAVGDAMKTPSNSDDLTIFTRMLSGNDKLTLSSESDWIDGKGGNDTIRGGGGDDTLLGGSGRDSIGGQAGKDRLIGGTGNDTLSSSKDWQRDVFVFNGTSGRDTLSGFEDRIDRIEITSGATSFRQVSVRDSGADALVRFGDSSILIKNIDHRLITEADFLFT